MSRARDDLRLKRKRGRRQERWDRLFRFRLEPKYTVSAVGVRVTHDRAVPRDEIHHMTTRRKR